MGFLLPVQYLIENSVGFIRIPREYRLLYYSYTCEVNDFGSVINYVYLYMMSLEASESSYLYL